jgi:hypothetical protein
MVDAEKASTVQYRTDEKSSDLEGVAEDRPS